MTDADLLARLEAHARLHDGYCEHVPQDAEQAQWAADLRAAARLIAEREAAAAAMRKRCADLVRNAASYGLCCSDGNALADLVAEIGTDAELTGKAGLPDLSGRTTG